MPIPFKTIDIVKLKGRLVPWGHHIILTSILLLFFISPVLQSYPKAKVFFDLLFWTALSALAMLNWKNSYARAITIILILAALATSLGMQSAIKNRPLLLIHECFSLLTMMMVFASLIKSLTYARKASWDTISGAVCAYMTMAATWTNAFILVEMICPGSFNIPSCPETIQGYERLMNEMFYFSIVTIATVGYGDITPASNLTRMLVSLEAIMGQFFIAVTLARVVSIQMRSLQKEWPDCD